MFQWVIGAFLGYKNIGCSSFDMVKDALKVLAISYVCSGIFPDVTIPHVMIVFRCARILSPELRCGLHLSGSLVPPNNEYRLQEVTYLLKAEYYTHRHLRPPRVYLTGSLKIQ